MNIIITCKKKKKNSMTSFLRVVRTFKYSPLMTIIIREKSFSETPPAYSETGSPSPPDPAIADQLYATCSMNNIKIPRQAFLRVVSNIQILYTVTYSPFSLVTTNSLKCNMTISSLVSLFLCTLFFIIPDCMYTLHVIRKSRR